MIPLLQSPIALTSPNGKDNASCEFDSGDDQSPDHPESLAGLRSAPDSDEGNPGGEHETEEDEHSQEDAPEAVESVVQPYDPDDASADVDVAPAAVVSPPKLGEASSSMDSGGGAHDAEPNSQNAPSAAAASGKRVQKRHPNLEAATKSWLLNFHVIFPKTKRALEDLCHNMYVTTCRE